MTYSLPCRFPPARWGIGWGIYFPELEIFQIRPENLGLSAFRKFLGASAALAPDGQVDHPDHITQVWVG